MSNPIQQVTLAGTPADERTRPKTMMYCDDCGEYILRSHRHDHPHPLTPIGDVAEGGLPQECRFDTQTFTVEYHMTYIETVRVEASSMAEAKELADHRRTYDGEYVDTVHTDAWSFGEPSQASEEYLREMGLLPEEPEP